jgi:hypothetical protein
VGAPFLWSREDAAGGKSVRLRDVHGMTTFPESEYAARKAAWSMPWTGHGGVYGG